jgi:hypothetical protein
MRRVVVSPTFAAGLGVVVAAVLAFHISGTVFRYSAPDWGSRRCPATGCTGARHHGGSPAVVRSGVPLRTAAPATPPPEAPAVSPSAGHAGAPQPAPPAVGYVTAHTVPGGFVGRITVTFAGGKVPAHWAVWLSYPARRIYGVLGGQWRPDGGHAVSVTGGGPQLLSPHGVIHIEFWVSGSPAPPSGCSVDHTVCRLS